MTAVPIPQPEFSGLLTTTEVANLLGVAKRHIYRLDVCLSSRRRSRFDCQHRRVSGAVLMGVGSDGRRGVGAGPLRVRPPEPCGWLGLVPRARRWA